ncbi:MAG: hypothetical protein AAF581_02800 [Planctomycetota bacterium]
MPRSLTARSMTPWLLTVCLLGLGPAGSFADDDAPTLELPGLPPVEFANPDHAAQYAKGLALLEQGQYKKAASEFRRLKSKVPAGSEREGVTRAFLESQGGVDLEKALAHAKKERLRKALAHLEKITSKYEGTEIGEQIEFHRQAFWSQLFHPIETFETKPSGDKGDSDEEATDDDPEEEEEERGGRNRRRGGESGFGQNTRVVEKEDDAAKVRKGENALQWNTGKYLAAISFENLPRSLSDYRYLNISLRSDGDERPQILLLFDCLDWRGQGGGGGRRGGGRAGGAWVYQRDGFSLATSPRGKWQDLRLDLKKFTQKGTGTWDSVKALRLVHMPGISAQLYIDEITLEKE